MPAGVDPFTGFQALRNVLVDRNTATLSRALSERGISHVLLKGPAIARWLYDADSEVRAYFDTDLLIPPDRWVDVVDLLGELQYDPEPDAFGHPRMEGITGFGFVSGEAHVDIHSNIDGLGADPATTWSVLSSRTETIELDGTALPCLDETARLLHVALHAAHHHDGVPLEDLRRALARCDDSAWSAAADLARTLDAHAFFATGLRLLDEGRAVAERIDAGDGSVKASLWVGDVPVASGLNELLATPGVARKARVLREELAPSREFMQWWTSLARRPRGLPAAYAYRWLWMAAQLPRAVLTVARTRRRYRD